MRKLPDAHPETHQLVPRHIRRPPHQVLPNVVYPPLLQPQTVPRVFPRTAHQRLDRLAYKLVQLLKHHPRLFLRQGTHDGDTDDMME